MSKFNEVIQLESNLIELKKALLHSQRAEAKAKFKTANLIEAVYEAAANSLLSTPRPKIIPPLKDARKGKPEVALVHLTDWQAGKKTISYDIPALSSRMEAMIKKVLSLTEIQRAHHPVRECVVMLGGDMVEGVGIFPGQQYEVSAHLYEQLFEVVRIIEGCIRSLAQSFEKVTVVCEFGNHGRLGKKGEMPAGDNIDRMAYQIAANNCKDIKHVKWQMSDDWYQIFHIGNYKVLLVHGDEIGSSASNSSRWHCCDQSTSSYKGSTCLNGDARACRHVVLKLGAKDINGFLKRLLDFSRGFLNSFRKLF